MIKLGVNIDHIATVRNARGEDHPNLIKAAKFVSSYGADIITVHRREDERHVKKKDVIQLKKEISKPINLEMAANQEMLRFALKIKPKYVCIVPEKRKEITTEGGLNLKKNNLSRIIKKLKSGKIEVSLFIDPKILNIKLAKRLGADSVEIHTGKFAKLHKLKIRRGYVKEFKKIEKCSVLAHKLGLNVKMGHGLDYNSTKYLCKIKQVCEFNVGHFIIGEAIIFGIKHVIKKFRKIITN